MDGYVPEKIRRILWLNIAALSIVLFFAGCTTVKPLSRQERAAVRTLCVVSDLDPYFTYCKYRRGTEKIPLKRISDYVLYQVQSDLKKKGYVLTENPDAADYRLVIRPATIRFFEDKSAFDGFAVSAFYSEIQVHAAIVMGLVDPKTGNCRISRLTHWMEPTGIEYAPDLWEQFSSHEKEKLLSAMEKAATPASRSCLKQMGF